MCFGDKPQPAAHYTYSSPPRPSSPSRVHANQAIDRRSTIPSAATAGAQTAAMAGYPAADKQSTPPPYEQSAYELSAQSRSNAGTPQDERRPTIPDLPIPVTRRSSGENLPIPVRRAQDTNDFPIPVHTPTRADDQSLPIPLTNPAPGGAPISSPSSSALSASSDPTSPGSQKKKKSGTHWNPFSTPKQKDPTRFKTDDHNPYLHSKPAVPSPACATMSPYDAEQAYSQGFRDAQAGLPNKTPWGIAGEHYSRGYRFAAEAKARAGGYPMEAGGVPGWSVASPREHATALAPGRGQDSTQIRTSAPKAPASPPQLPSGMQELGGGGQAQQGQWAPRVDVTGQVEQPPPGMQPWAGASPNLPPNAGYRDADVGTHMNEAGAEAAVKAKAMLASGGSSWRQSPPPQQQQHGQAMTSTGTGVPSETGRQGWGSYWANNNG